eukprot:gb/GEZN01003009.1/.p1 GENE.gb/GEZN01003009.1/~~gb/GEZN01003009.1/.p1  ORF type:complete len:634 (-),score=57.37 gb/GEZN01003009.1/:232-2133(-)
MAQQAQPTCHTCKTAIVTSHFIKVGDYSFHGDHFTCSVCTMGLKGVKFQRREDSFFCAGCYSDKFAHRCLHCNHKIEGKRAISVMGSYYHPEHFVCFKCEKPLAGGQYFEGPDKHPYCEDDFYLLSATSCALCGKAVTEKEGKVTVEGSIYHPNCVNCEQCGKRLDDGGSIVKRLGKLYCKDDYLTLFCKICTECGKPVTDHCISVNDEFYHPACLLCSVCNKQLDRYLCVGGFLRCAEHQDFDSPTIVCGYCHKNVYKSVVRSCGLKTHADCFKCGLCSAELKKSEARLKNDMLCCQDCALGKKELPAEPPKKDNHNLNVRESQLFDFNEMKKTALAASVASANEAQEAKEEEELQNREVASLGVIKWKKSAIIGKGAFGVVYEAMNLDTGELIAVKQVTLDDNSEAATEALSEIQNEINVMSGLRHKNIVSLLGTDRDGTTLSILMEYVPGKSLDVLLEKYGVLSEGVIRSYTTQILSALSYCHSKKVVHRDIKGKNILVDKSGKLKLADFGSAKRVANMDKMAPTQSYNYTPLWTAPEVLTGDYNSKVDIWSLGCVIIEMASANTPWAEQNFENPFRALYHIGNSNSIPKIPDTLSPVAVDFVKTCLTRNPDLRPHAQELLNHKFIVSGK